MGLTGLFLCSFLVVHLYINLFLFEEDHGADVRRLRRIHGDLSAACGRWRSCSFPVSSLHMILGDLALVDQPHGAPAEYAVTPAGRDERARRRGSMWVTGGVRVRLSGLHVNAFFVQLPVLPSTGGRCTRSSRRAFRDPWTVAFYLVALSSWGIISSTDSSRRSRPSACGTPVPGADRRAGHGLLAADPRWRSPRSRSISSVSLKGHHS